MLIPLGLTPAASAEDARGIHKKILGLGCCHSSSTALHKPATLIISNDDMKKFIEIVKSLENSGLLKGVSKIIQNEAKEQKGGFLSILLGTLGATLLGNILAGKGINRAEERAIAKRQGRGIVRAGYGNKKQDYKKKMDF